VDTEVTGIKNKFSVVSVSSCQLASLTGVAKTKNALRPASFFLLDDAIYNLISYRYRGKGFH
jgi:hypothetical protein